MKVKKQTKIGLLIRAEIEAGRTRPEIVKRLRLTGNTVNKWWDYWAEDGVCAKRGKLGRSNPNPHKDRILELMRSEHPDNAIYNSLKSLGVTRGVISGLRSRHHVPHRGSRNVYIHNPTKGGFQPRMGEPFRQFLLANILSTRQDDGNRMPLRDPIPLEELRGWEHYHEMGPYTFDELPHNSCTYPVGEHSPHLFCGHDKEGNRNYCPTHMDLIHDRSPEAVQKIKWAMTPPRERAVKLPWRSDAKDVIAAVKPKGSIDDR